MRLGGSKRDRDRATEAFRRWARAGCPDADEMKMGTRKYDADIRACAAVFAMLKEESLMAKRGAGRMNTASGEIMHAVRCVYMEEPTRPMRRAEVTMRVRRVACERYVTERMVYNWLATARRMWLDMRK